MKTIWTKDILGGEKAKESIFKLFDMAIENQESVLQLLKFECVQEADESFKIYLDLYELIENIGLKEEFDKYLLDYLLR